MRLIYATILAFVGGSVIAAEPTNEQIEFFEKKIRPIFVDNCVKCHGAKKQEAGLRLDTAAGLKKGTDTGPVVVAGDPAKSLLVKSVRREGEYAMPPSKALPPEAVAALTEWVKIGAPFPADSVQVGDAATLSKSHWAFQPVRDPVVPKSKLVSDTANPIDRFLAAKWEQHGLTPSPLTDARTLIRRVSLDLTGLPPTADEADAFANDKSPNAYERLVDRLLASPQYGERWGRHWLDLARYSDTKGYVFTEDINYPYAYTFREYVIRSLNEDKPYDTFLKEQLAADRMNLGDDKRPLAALGFLTVGRRFSNNPHDIIDDRIDLVTRGLMGITVACARCHDHKFDPIPTADYYSLYGVFASSVEPKDLPIIGDVPRTPEFIAFEADLKKKQDLAADFATKMYEVALAPFRTSENIARYLLATKELSTLPNTNADKFAAERKMNPTIFDRWRKFLTEAKKRNDPIFVPWFAASEVPEKDIAAKLATLPKTVHPYLLTMLSDSQPKSLADVAAIYGELLAESLEPNAGKPDPARAALANVLIGIDSPTNPPPAEADKVVVIATKKIFRGLRNDADKFRSNSPYSPPRAMVMNDAPQPTEPVVFLRGNPNNRGVKIPRQMPAAVGVRKPFVSGSGRLELATSIASADNPLTARVFVNRVWMHHFGQGLVRSTSNFGLRGELPSHPELLDYLAKRFMNEGWSIKTLHRRILTSQAYRQSSRVLPDAAARDPENIWLARMNRTRTDFEIMRDGFLFAAGALDTKVVGGRSVNLFTEPFAKRRAVYGFVDRQNLPGTFRVFDFASPEQHSPQRFQTTVPQQSLFLMNSPFTMSQAAAVAARPEVAQAKTPEAKVTAIYRIILGRNPTATEWATVQPFATEDTMPAYTYGVWAQLAQVLLLSNEFAFVD